VSETQKTGAFQKNRTEFVMGILTKKKIFIRGDQIGLFKLVTLNCILNRITGVTFGC
jgi:hypothetical protein